MSPNRRPLPFDPVAEAKRQWKLRWVRSDEMAAATSVMRAQQIVLTSVENELRPFNLTFARYEALVLLYFSRNGSLPMGKMGDRLQVHATSVTNAVDRLEQHGLVRRLNHATDRRTTLAELTPQGRKVVLSATKRLTATGFGLAGLSTTQLNSLTSILEKVRETAGDFDTESTTVRATG